MPDRKNNRLLQHKQPPAQSTPLVINLDDYYSIKELAGKDMFDKSDRTIFNWRKEGKLEAIDFNGHVLFEKGPTDIALERYRRLGFF